MKSKKLAISIALSTIMMTSVFAGCSKDKSEKSVKTDSGNNEVITIKLAADSIYEFNPEKDELAKFILDKFKIKFENVGYEGDMEKMMLDASSGQLADVCYTEPLYDLYSFATFIDNGFFRSIPDKMLAKYPNIKKMIDSSDVCKAVKAHYGDNFILPKPDSRDPNIYIGERKGIFYRKDWLKKVGIAKEPTTWEELYNMAKAFTINDPDGNGKNDTFGLTSDSFGNFRYFMANVGHSNLNWVKGPDGQWTHGALLEDNIEALNWFRKMYKDGYLDPEFASTKYEQAMQKFASGKFGAVNRNADADWLNNVIVKSFYAANAQQYPDPFAVVGVIPTLAKDSNSKPGIDKYIDTMCATQISAKLSDDKLERYLAFHDYFVSEEGEMFTLGFENKDWKKENGKVVKILNSDGGPTDLAKAYPSMPVIKMGSWGFHLQANPSLPTFDKFNDQIKALNSELVKKRNTNVVPSDMRIKLISEKSMLDANSFKFTTEYANIIMGSEPVDKMFKDMVKKAMSSGFDQAIQDVNRIAKSKGWN
jgi:putative aldouronate transport system substrate-binding protein